MIRLARFAGSRQRCPGSRRCSDPSAGDNPGRRRAAVSGTPTSYGLTGQDGADSPTRPEVPRPGGVRVHPEPGRRPWGVGDDGGCEAQPDGGAQPAVGMTGRVRPLEAGSQQAPYLPDAHIVPFGRHSNGKPKDKAAIHIGGYASDGAAADPQATRPRIPSLESRDRRLLSRGLRVSDPDRRVQINQLGSRPSGWRGYGPAGAADGHDRAGVRLLSQERYARGRRGEAAS